jgi:dephospho-CoA kinase
MPNDPERSLLVGVTGGVGSGKSTVCECFEQLGRTVLRADRIAREVTDNDPSVKAAIAESFGAEVIRPDGSLDRKALAAKAFTDPQAIAALNAIVHPPVFEAMDRMLENLPADKKRPYVLIEAALIYETHMDRWLDRVIVVDAPEDVRIQRVMDRDGCSKDDVLRRMAVQLPTNVKVKQADFVVVNSNNTADLTARISLIDKLLLALPAGE